MPRSARHAKARGELAEIRFLLAATAKGLVVNKPWGDNQPFDFLVGRRSFWYRVQVKSCAVMRHRAFRVKTSRAGGRRRYTRRHIDFLVAYIVPHRVWYIVPVQKLAGRHMISVYPQQPASRGMYEKFRNRWDLLQP